LPTVFSADADYLTAANPKACPTKRFAKRCAFWQLRLALYIPHQHKVYKRVSISTIVLIGINQSIGIMENVE
jgi:hypothetical protein